MKKTNIIMIIIIIIIVIIATFAFSIYLNKLGITAMDGREKADVIAKKWDSTCFLVRVQSGGTEVIDGKSILWIYEYSTNSNPTNQSENFSVMVRANGKSESWVSNYDIRLSIINNWTIDSDMAYNIAKTDSTVSNWLFRYSGASCPVMILGSNDTCISWNLGWSSAGLLDDPHNIAISVDANSGQIITVYYN